MHRKSRLLMLVTKYRSGGLVSHAKSNVLLSYTTKNENKYQRIQKFKTLNLKQYFSRHFEQQADISYQLDDICSRGSTILHCAIGSWLYFKETPGPGSQIKIWRYVKIFEVISSCNFFFLNQSAETDLSFITFYSEAIKNCLSDFTPLTEKIR